MSTATAKKVRPWEAGAKPGKPADVSSPPVAPVEEAPKAGDNSAPIVDEYGAVDSQIKALEKRKKELSDQIKALGAGEHNGTKCKAVVSITPTTRLDTDAIKAAFDETVIAKFSKTSDVVKVSIKALV